MSETQNNKSSVYLEMSSDRGVNTTTGKPSHTLTSSLTDMVNVLAEVIPRESFDGSSPIHGDQGKQLSTHLMSDQENHVGEDSHFKLVSNDPKLTIFLLINTMIGSGVLNQPFVFRESGFLGGIVGYIFASIMTWLGLNFLTAAGVKCGIYEYGKLAKHAMGDNGETIIDWAITIGSFGSILGYILIVGSTISGLLTSWGCTSDACGIYLTTIISIGIFVAPICLFRHFGHLAFLSVFSVFAILCVLFLVIIGGPFLADDGPVQVFNVDGTFRSLGSIVFSLSCASANFQAFITTKKESQSRGPWMGITGYVVGIGSFLLIAMGVAGYACFRGDTDGIILDNFHGNKFDFFKVMVAVHIILYIPVNFVIMRYSIVKLMFKMKSEELSMPTHTSLSLILLALSTVFMLLFIYAGLSSGAAFTVILNITGGVSGSLTSFLLPSIIVYKLLDPTDWLHKASKVVFVLGIAIMLIVIIETALQFS